MWHPLDRWRRWTWTHIQAPKIEANKASFTPEVALYMSLRKLGPVGREVIVDFLMDAYKDSFRNRRSCSQYVYNLVQKGKQEGLLQENGDGRIRLVRHGSTLPVEISIPAGLTLWFWLGITFILTEGLTLRFWLLSLGWSAIALGILYESKKVLKLHP